MRKGKIKKVLKKYFTVKTMYYPIYDFVVKTDSKSYFIKVLNVTSNHQITVNSRDIWNLKKGKINGIRFNTISSELLKLKDFNKLDNKIIVLTNKPYKILKVLNESDLKDISNELFINDIFITYDIDELLNHLNSK